MTQTGPMRIILACLAIFAGPVALACGQLPPLDLPGATEADVSVRAAPSTPRIAPGGAFHLIVELTIRDGVWLYSATPRGQVAPPKPLEIQVDAGRWRVGSPRLPRPQWHTISVAGLTDSNLVYTGSIRLYVPVTAGGEPADGTQTITVRVTGQTCDEKGCYQVDERAEATVAVDPGAPTDGTTAIPPEAKTAARWDRQLGQGPPGSAAASTPAGLPGADMATWAALGLALLAGIALNVTPCVLPVIPIKIASLLQQARQSRRRSITLGMAYAAGIVLFFLAMGAASVAVRLAAGAVFDLNEPFGHPWFLIGLALLLIVAALWLFGVITPAIGGRFGAFNPQQGHVGSVGMGFVTGVLATPCSGPVLVTVFGWAQGQPAWAGAAVFALLGLGMGAPHAILAAMPGLLERLPAPGPWMERLKQAMGLILLMVAVWLIACLGVAAWIGWVAAYAVILAGCLWMAGSWVDINTPAAKRRTVRIVALAIAVVAGWLMLPPPAPERIDWRPLEPGAINRAVSDGRVVLVKFTARWCAVCKIVDYKVYNHGETADAIAERDVVAIKADVTRNTSDAAKMLNEQLGEPGPPVTVVYGPALDEPIRLHGIFDRAELTAALDRAAGSAAER